MAEKKKSLADQAYEIIKNNIMNLTYPPGMASYRSTSDRRARYEP